jgi:RND family efflux transporter MFP subunit
MRDRRLLAGIAAIAVVWGSIAVPPADAAELDCLIEPHVTVNVSTAVDGLVETVTVDRGDLVQEGQMLATLESGVERATVTAARARVELESPFKSNQARLDFSVRRLARNEELLKNEIISLREVDEAETMKLLAETGLLEAVESKRLAELELQRATAALAMRTIRSPITGVVVERFLSPGEFTKQTPILKLAQIDPLRVEVFAPVSLLRKIAVGMQAEVVPEAPLNGALRARVKVVDRVVDAASGTFGVRLELPNPGHRIPAGLKCKVRLPG